MKVLYLGKRYVTASGWTQSFFRIKEAIKLGDYADVVYCGKGGFPFVDCGYDVARIVKKEDPDVIYVGQDVPKWRNLDKVKVPKVVKRGDPWTTFNHNVGFVKDNNVDLVLWGNWTKLSDEWRLRSEVPCAWHPWGVDEQLFKDMGLKKKHDWCSITGHGLRHRAYPLTFAIPQLRVKYPNHAISNKYKHSYEEYVKIINESKIFPFGAPYLSVVPNGGKIRWATAKFFEVMACGTLVMSNLPDDAEILHFEDGVNMVSAYNNDLVERFKYYLEHGNIRREICRNGRETILKYHTLEIRTRQLLNHLESVLKK